MAKFAIIVISLMCVNILSFSLASREMTEAYMQEIMRSTVELKGYNTIFEIGEIYGVTPNLENFKPGDDFLTHYENTKELPVFIAAEFFGTKNPENAATAYEPQYVKDKYSLVNDNSNKNRLTLIIGDPRTGKSTTLEIFEMKYRQKTAKGLTIFMDLPKIIESDVKVESLTFDYLIERSVSNAYSGLVKNVVEINPSRIEFFIDGLDQVPHAREKFLSIVSETHKKGISITATSCTDVSSNLAIEESELSKIEIPSSLPESEILDYTKRVWQTTYEARGRTLEPSFLDEYVKTFKIITQDTPIPRTFEMAHKMAVVFTNPEAIRPVPSPADYIVNNNARLYVPRVVIEISDRMHFDKMTFYNEYFEHLNPMIEVYGPVALDMITKNTEVRPQIEAANRLLTTHGADAFKFLTFENGRPVDFVHPEFKRFFAAKYVLDSFKTESPLVETFKEMMAKPAHAFTLEFIDSAINNVHNQDIKGRIHSLLTTTIDTEASNEWAHEVTDHLIEFRMDNLCSEMFKALGKTRYTEYLNDQTVQLTSKNKYGTGMLAGTKLIDTYDYIPRKTRSMYSGNRAEMIVNLMMRTTRNILIDEKYPVDAKIVLETIAKYEPSHLRSFLEQRRGNPFPTEVINKIMYESVQFLGASSLEVIRTLKEFGGTPEHVNVEGRTLTHVIVETCNRKFLETAHREFNVPLVETPSMKGNTILFALLDSGMTFNTMSAPEAWETMAYLLEHGDISWSLEYINAHSNDFRNFEPSLMEKPDAYRKLLVTSYATDDIRLKYVDLVLNYVQLKDWDMPSDILSTRRKVLIKSGFRDIDNGRPRVFASGNSPSAPDSLTLTEVVVSHLERNPSVAKYSHYLDCVKTLLRKEGNTFNSFQSQRAFEAIAKNMLEPSHIPNINLDTLKRVIATEVVPQATRLDVVTMNTAFENRKQHRLPVRTVDRTLDSIIIETLYDFECNSELGRISGEISANRADNGYDSASEFYACIEGL